MEVLSFLDIHELFHDGGPYSVLWFALCYSIDSLWFLYVSDLRNERVKFSIHFTSMFDFFTPWKRQKTSDFLTFPGGIEMQHWREIGYVLPFDLSNLWKSRGFPTWNSELVTPLHIQVRQARGVETTITVCKFRSSRPEVLRKNSCSNIFENFQENSRGGDLF